MKCLRIYATADGESRFGDIEIPTTRRPVSPEIAAFPLMRSPLAKTDPKRPCFH